MANIHRNNYFILTGAMGAGKSTILTELRKLGVVCMDEPARQILAEQRSIQGNGIPDKDKKLFTDLLLSRSISQFKQTQNHQGLVVFDRGIPDNIGYTQLFDLNTEIAFNASHQYRYNTLVFFLPGWSEIYVNDDERKMSFDEANQFGYAIKKIYASLAYEIVDVPFYSPQARAKFILGMIAERFPTIIEKDHHD